MAFSIMPDPKARQVPVKIFLDYLHPPPVSMVHVFPDRDRAPRTQDHMKLTFA